MKETYEVICSCGYIVYSGYVYEGYRYGATRPGDNYDTGFMCKACVKGRAIRGNKPKGGARMKRRNPITQDEWKNLRVGTEVSNGRYRIIVGLFDSQMFNIKIPDEDQGTLATYYWSEFEEVIMDEGFFQIIIPD